MSKLVIDLDRDGCVALAGRLDTRSATAARAALQDLADTGQGEFVLDLGEVEIWDRAGLGVVVGLARRCRSRGRGLVLLGPGRREQRLLRMAGVTRIARVADSTSVVLPADACEESDLLGA